MLYLDVDFWRYHQTQERRGNRWYWIRIFASRMRVHVVASTAMFCTVSTICLSLVIKVQPWKVLMTYHCGKVSSQRMCLRLQVRQPFRDLVWLLRGGPAPEPGITLFLFGHACLDQVLKDGANSRTVKHRNRSPSNDISQSSDFRCGARIV